MLGKILECILEWAKENPWGRLVIGVVITASIMFTVWNSLTDFWKDKIIEAILSPSSSELVGKWKHSARTGDVWDYKRFIQVDEKDGNLIITVIKEGDIPQDHKVTAVNHGEFDGKIWTIKMHYSDNVMGKFIFTRDSKDQYSGELVTNNSESDSKHKLTRFD